MFSGNKVWIMRKLMYTGSMSNSTSRTLLLCQTVHRVHWFYVKQYIGIRFLNFSDELFLARERTKRI